MRWILLVVLAYVVADLFARGRITATAAGAVTGSVRGAARNRRTAKDQFLKQDNPERWQRRERRREIREGMRIGAREGARTGARSGLEAREKLARRARYGTKVAYHSLRAWQDKRNPAAWIALGEALLSPVAATVPDAAVAPVPRETKEEKTTPVPRETDLACPTCEDRGVLNWDHNSTVDCPDCIPTPTGRKTTAMPHATEIGASLYLKLLDGLPGQIETALGELDEIRDQVVTLTEVAEKYDHGYGAEAAAQLHSAISAIGQASELLEAWRSGAHSEHDVALEAASGAKSEALRTYAGDQ